MWKGLIVLLGFCNLASIVDGERIAVRMCKEYQKVTAIKSSLLPLPIFGSPVDVISHDCVNVVQLIVGGEPAQYGEFPHHAILGYLKKDTIDEYKFECGGSLISDQHVLTAAHCFAMEYPSIVRLGVYEIANNNAGRQFDIEGFLKHPKHRFGKVYHDIALVKLENRVFFTPSIRPACLWDIESRNTSKFIASGFGYTGMLKDLSTNMMKVVLEEFPAEDCAERLNFTNRFKLGITDGQLCVGSTSEGRDTCEGDSGGPLQTVTNPTTCTYHVVGVVSTGLKGCGVGTARAVYTKVSYYLDWIEENVWGPKANSMETYEKI